MRRGATLIELAVSLVVAAVVLGIVASISVREQRVFGDLANATGLANQLREAATILPTDLRVASPAAGDIVSGEARDTSLQLRATLASAVVCDTGAAGSAGAIVLPAVGTDAATLASGTSTIQPGDSAWIYSPADSGDAWTPYRVSSVTSVPAAPCAAAGPVLDSATVRRSRVLVALASPPSPLASTIGAPVRFTRPLRYSVYRASDGAWYVGERDWNAATQRFNSIQPIAGPMLSAARGGMEFQYFDSLARPLTRPVADARGVALVRVVLRGETRDAVRTLAVARDVGARANDSTMIAIFLHNRR